jgi:hypothetical protein
MQRTKQLLIADISPSRSTNEIGHGLDDLRVTGLCFIVAGKDREEYEPYIF